MTVVRIVMGGLAATLAWGAGLVVVFGPAQRILADPDLQSAKFPAVVTQPPLPRIAENSLALLLALTLAWALMVPWFEFYLPWNAMHEPLSLVLLESLCWLVVLVGVGLVIAAVQSAVRPRSRASA